MNLPTKIAVLITARRLSGVVQPDGASVIGFPNQITYDFESLEADFILQRQGVIPTDRIVAPDGTQVRIRAASGGSEATLEVLGSEERLFVREGIVFGDCT